MADSIFTKVINGEVPSHKIYEDELTYAFLDIHPSMPGHTLVVTKTQVDKFTDLADQDYIALWSSVKLVSKQLLKVLGTDRVRLAVVGTDVPHVHVHLIPFNEGDKKVVEPDQTQEPNHESLSEMAKKLAF